MVKRAELANTDWIMTYSGKKFYPFHPTVESICIEDIAHALAQKCRFNGQCPEFYSIARHSMNLVKLLQIEGVNSAEILLAGLLHDSAEAYFPDIPRPIKQQFPQMFLSIEDCILEKIFKKFDVLLSLVKYPVILRIDAHLAYAERRKMRWRVNAPRWPGEPAKRIPITAIELSSPSDEKEFRHLFYSLVLGAL